MNDGSRQNPAYSSTLYNSILGICYMKTLHQWINEESSPVLEVPEGTNVMELPLKHFVSLVKKKGRKDVIRGLTNLEVWFKHKKPSLSAWAKKMKADRNDALGKND